MPIFDISGHTLTAVEQKNFSQEKELQSLIEANLEALFNCRFITNAFSIESQTEVQIDSVGLSSDSTPVIIGYKTVESSELINQSLFYSHLIQAHKSDFEYEVESRLGGAVTVDWADIRVICIAPNYKQFDVHAAQVMGANLELWEYRLFTNNSLSLELVLDNSSVSAKATAASAEPIVEPMPITIKEAVEKESDVELIPSPPEEVSAPVAPLSGDELTKTQSAKKAELNRPKVIYTLDGKPKSKSETTKDLMGTIRNFIMSLDPSIEEVTKKFYVAYKTSQASKNFACMELKTETIQLFLNLKPSDIPSDTLNFKDVSKICHYGTGDVEFTVDSELDFEPIKAFIAMSHRKAGGQF